MYVFSFYYLNLNNFKRNLMNFKKSIYSNSKFRLISEIIILFIIVPVLLAVYKLKIPLMLVLLVFGILIFLFLKYDDSFDLKKIKKFNLSAKQLRKMIAVFLFSAVIMVMLIYIIDKNRLFLLVKKVPWLLLLISVFYPLFSVIPQTLIYRLFFFHRYKKLYKNDTLKIIFSALFFAFGHLLYKNVLVLLLAFVAGLIFSYHYYKTKSFWISVIEHSLYGVWLFASGLGYFFVSQFVE